MLRRHEVGLQKIINIYFCRVNNNRPGDASFLAYWEKVILQSIIDYNWGLIISNHFERFNYDTPPSAPRPNFVTWQRKAEGQL